MWKRLVYFFFQDAIISYKQKHYENRAANQFFEPYMVRNSTFFNAW